MVRQDFAGPGLYPTYVRTDLDLEFGQSGNERDHGAYEPSTVVRASSVLAPQTHPSRSPPHPTPRLVNPAPLPPPRRPPPHLCLYRHLQR
jgi:hypothetical protein